MKRIPLTQGKYAIVDNDDFVLLNKYKWCLTSNGYAKRQEKNNTILMHRIVMNANSGDVIDHINMDKLDCRKSNLRFCTHSQNHANTRHQLNNTSGYKGVTWSKKNKKWLAHIKINQKLIYLGYFLNKKEAAIAYNKAARKYHGKFAKLNVIK